MPIPEFDPATGYLPPGDHDATMEEVRARFVMGYRRKEIYDGLEHVVGRLVDRGVSDIWLDGSFVTDKRRPDDVDVVYKAPAGADVMTWDLLSPANRKRLKKYHRVDLWLYSSYQQVGLTSKRITIKEFFESKDGVQKGIVRLKLGEE